MTKRQRDRLIKLLKELDRKRDRVVALRAQASKLDRQADTLSDHLVIRMRRADVTMLQFRKRPTARKAEIRQSTTSELDVANFRKACAAQRIPKHRWTRAIRQSVLLSVARLLLGPHDYERAVTTIHGRRYIKITGTRGPKKRT